MIGAADLRELLDRHPFEPFRIRMTDGNYFDVVNPDLAVVMKLLSYENMTTLENSDVSA